MVQYWVAAVPQPCEVRRSLQEAYSSSTTTPTGSTTSGTTSITESNTDAESSVDNTLHACR
jgi:hypothetical protein